MNKEQFITNVLELGILLDEKQLEQLDKYYHLLISWNEKINLTAITKKEDVYLKHFYDSLTLAKVVNLNEKESLCDIGTGAGFPGLVLKITFPHLKVTLLDSLQKRVNFLNHVIKELDLKDIEAIHDRAEIHARKTREKYDVTTARAVSKLNILLEYAIPMTKVNGVFVAMKANANLELEKSKNALSILKCKIIEEKQFKLPLEESNRTLFLIQKIDKTPSSYPRNFDKINKKPL